MEVDVKIDPVSEGLENGDDPRPKRSPGHNLEVTAQGPEGRAAEIAQEAAIELEEDPQPLGDGEDDLAMRDIQEKRIPHPLRPFLDALGMAGRAESPGPAGEHDQPLFGAVRAPYAGDASSVLHEPCESGRIRISCFHSQDTLDHLLDDQPKIPILPLEPALFLGQEPVEMMEQHPGEDGAFRMSRTIDSRCRGR